MLFIQNLFLYCALLIKKYNYEPYAQENNLQITTATGTKVFTFTTKDFTFGNLSARKKIYKVYITYRTTSGNNSNIVVNTSINGGSITTSTPFSASKSKFFGTSTACYHASNGLLDTGGGSFIEIRQEREETSASTVVVANGYWALSELVDLHGVEIFTEIS